MAVSVVTMGADTKRVDYTVKMTIAQALSAAGVSPQTGSMVTVDGKKVEDSTAPVRDNSKIVVTPRIANG